MSSIRFLYDTALGRVFLRMLTRPWPSRLAGAFMNTGLSRLMIPGFIRRNGIDMSDYSPRPYQTFNDFFTRELKAGARPLPEEESALIAPCDARLSVYSIEEDSRFSVKGQSYTVADLLGFSGEGDVPLGEDDPLADLLALESALLGGTALIFRLCVDDYHRYVYFDDGVQDENVHIPGQFHTVRPEALERVRVLARNSREYCVLDTAHFGRCVQVEVGAMMVGRIVNHRHSCAFRRGEEKGMFRFGGSTVVLLLGPEAAALRPDLEAIRGKNTEIRVRLGEAIGCTDLGVSPQTP